jgi:hypothetical protein
VRHTLPRVAVTLLAIVGGSLALAVPTAGASSTYTWSGEDSSSPNWSVGDNWMDDVAPLAGDPADSLIFPANLTGGDCSTDPAPCYVGEDDLAGYSIDELTIDDASDYYLGPDSNNDGLTIGSGGIDATTALSSPGDAEFGMPITLDAPQSWTVSGSGGGASPDGLQFDAPLTAASQSSDTLGIDLSASSAIALSGDNELGTVTAQGGDSTDTGFDSPYNGAIVLSGGVLNASDGRQLNLGNTALFGYGTVGPVVADGGEVGPGDPTGDLTIDGPLTLDQGASEEDPSYASFLINGTGMTPGTDYTTIHATGNVNLADAGLDIEPGSGADCPTLDLGTTYALISTPGTISGQFLPPSGGSAVDMDCEGSQPQFQINYNSGSPSTVSATIVGPAAESQTSLSVSGTGGTSVLKALIADYGGSVTARPDLQGLVSFTDNGAAIPGCAGQAVTVTSNAAPFFEFGTATCSFTPTTPGPYALQATFEPPDRTTDGNGVFASSSNIVSGTVAGAPALPSPTMALVETRFANGHVRTKVFCDTTSTLCSQVTVKLLLMGVIEHHRTHGVGHGLTYVGAASVGLTSGDNVVVKVALNAEGRRLLARYQKLEVEVVASSESTATTLPGNASGILIISKQQHRGR